MSRDLILDRTRASARVADFSTAAIRVVVKACCKLNLDLSSGELLARNLTPSEAIEHFRREEELAASQNHPHMSPARRAINRTYVVAKSAIVKNAKAGRPETDRDRKLLDEVRTYQEALSDTVRALKELKHLSARLKQTSRLYSRFASKADRLFRKQRKRLRATLLDPALDDVAHAKLIALYTLQYRDLLGRADKPAAQ